MQDPTQLAAMVAALRGQPAGQQMAQNTPLPPNPFMGINDAPASPLEMARPYPPSPADTSVRLGGLPPLRPNMLGQPDRWK